MKQNIKISLLDHNEGQIKDLPSNPRFIKDDEFHKLKNSILEDPELLDARSLLVIPNNKRFVVFCGNMRLRAVNEILQMPKAEFDALVESKRDETYFSEWYAAILLLKDKGEVPCYVFDKNTPAEKLRAYLIKDNVGFGSFDHEMLANEWDVEKLEDWGVHVIWEQPEDENKEEEVAGISKKLTVECESLEKLETLFIQLQKDGFICTLK